MAATNVHKSGIQVRLKYASGKTKKTDKRTYSSHVVYYARLLKGRQRCCNLSVRPSVCAIR